MLSVEAGQAKATANGLVAVAVMVAGFDGAVVSPFGPRRLVANAASSNNTSHVPVAVSPICN